jgi:hypothetical protein
VRGALPVRHATMNEKQLVQPGKKCGKKGILASKKARPEACLAVRMHDGHSAADVAGLIKATHQPS